ncbi:MAG: AAA family ATPase [Actinobacteria bacterium]|nr:AAA family ATPase [Actinomycetota bacterium]
MSDQHHDDTGHPDDIPDLRTPTSPEGLGLSRSLAEDLVIRRCVIDGRSPMTSIADKLHVSITVAESLLNGLRDRKLIEYDGMDGRAYVVRPTEAGQQFSTQRSRESNYCGPMPVPLALYADVVRHQRPEIHLDHNMLQRSFSDLVLSDGLLDQLGPAIHGDGAMFLYGPPGTGKSSVAERIIRAYGDVVLVPHCVEVDGQIVSVYDPTLHDAIDDQPAGMDRRWIACHRPAVITGGELHVGMLDLQLERDSGVYLAPLQMKANNGILVIDDFGRQAMTPDALLNRWIVPLDRSVDYLTLQGRKFEVPFELKVVLSTNLDPAKLGDEAFFRRIHNKIYIGACSDEQFDWILSRVTRKLGIDLEAAAAVRLRQAARSQGDGELRAYLPGVVCKLASAICRYENQARVLTPELIDRVLALYFTEDLGVERTGPPPHHSVEVPPYAPDPMLTSQVLVPPPYDGELAERPVPDAAALGIEVLTGEAQPA